MCSFSLWKFWLQFGFTIMGFAFAVLVFFFSETAGERTAAIGYAFALLFFWFNPPEMEKKKIAKRKKKRKYKAKV